MILNEPRFLALFAVTALAFFLSPARWWRHAVLIVSGLVFYSWYAGSFLPFVLGLVLLTFVLSGRVGVWLNVAALIWLLFYFKMSGNPDGLPGILTPEAAARALVFPLGLSFLTFELIHVALERRRGKLGRVSLMSLAAFALYFPCRMAGPIKRYQPFEASVEQARWSLEQGYRGAVRMLWGFMKKVVVADVIGLTVAELHWAASPLQVWKGLAAYALYIYCDFSAYSDIAIGMSWILGLSVPENFRAPYLSRNIREFWTRWHMSLTSWLSDYVFLPISRRLALRPLQCWPWLAAVIGYLVTFMICGLWHGTSMNFLLWGLYHGVLLSLYAVYTLSPLSLARLGIRGRLVEWVGRVARPSVTFAAVTLGWMLFAVQLPKARSLWAAMWKT